MKKCPYCAEEIQDEAIVCKHCGRDLNPKPSPTPTATTEAPKKTSPIIGGIGFFLLVGGVIVGAVTSNCTGPLPVILVLGGTILLVYALATGNIKLFGS